MTNEERELRQQIETLTHQLRHAAEKNVEHLSTIQELVARLVVLEENDRKRRAKNQERVQRHRNNKSEPTINKELGSTSQHWADNKNR